MNKKEKNTRNIIIAVVVIALAAVLAIAGMLASKGRNSEKYLEQLGDLMDRAELLELSAKQPYNDGTLSINDYETIMTLKMKADDAIIRVQNGKYKSSAIKKTIDELSTDILKYEKMLSDIQNGEGLSVAQGEENDETVSEEQVQASTAAEPATETTTAALTDTVSSFMVSIQEFQNECSLRHDKGEISEEQYMDILQLEIEAAQVMEEMKAGGNPDDLDKKAIELKGKMYDMATKVNSPLADNFK